MYIGIGPEKGKRIPDREAFGYACDCCRYGDDGEKEIFWMLAKECGEFREFVQKLVGWFYSGNWLFDDSDCQETSWIIRFSNGDFRSFFGTYGKAMEKARHEAQKKRTGFVIS